MARRRLRFAHHGKCHACAGPVTDWRTCGPLEVWCLDCRGTIRSALDSARRLGASRYTTVAPGVPLRIRLLPTSSLGSTQHWVDAVLR